MTLTSVVARFTGNQEACTVLGFSMANVALGLIASRFFTEVVTPEALGEYYLLMNLVLWLTVPTAATHVYIWRHWPLAREMRIMRKFARGMVVGLLLQAALVAIGSVALVTLQFGGALTGLFILVAGLTTSVSQVLEQVQFLERRRVVSGIFGLLGNPVRLLILGAWALFLRPTGLSLLGGHAVYSILTAVQ